MKREANWPRYMTRKALKEGKAAFYWSPATRDRKAGCPISPEALGPDYSVASKRAVLLNAHLDAWREGREQNGGVPAEIVARGSFAWLIRVYVASAAYERVSQRSRPEYEAALARIETMTTTVGTSVGDLPLESLSPPAVDKIYARLREGPRGPRIRQANLSIDITARAWDVVRRLHPELVPAENPWRGVLKVFNRQVKPAATRAEAYALAHALHEIGEPHLGAAALICFEWHQRPEHVRGGDITWADWRPQERPRDVFVRHPKTGKKGWLPLEDDDGTPFFPELEAYLSDLPRLGVPIVLTAGRVGPARPYSAVYAQRRVREARECAGLGKHVTLDACRHGGLTEIGNAGATEAESMALSMHSTPQAARLYVKRTQDQQVHALRKRRKWIEDGTRVGMGRPTQGRNEKR